MTGKQKFLTSRLALAVASKLPDGLLAKGDILILSWIDWKKWVKEGLYSMQNIKISIWTKKKNTLNFMIHFCGRSV